MSSTKKDSKSTVRSKRSSVRKSKPAENGVESLDLFDANDTLTTFVQQSDVSKTPLVKNDDSVETCVAQDEVDSKSVSKRTRAKRTASSKRKEPSATTAEKTPLKPKRTASSKSSSSSSSTAKKSQTLKQTTTAKKRIQPRGLDTDSLIGIAFHRAGMHTALQKFGRSVEELESRELITMAEVNELVSNGGLPSDFSSSFAVDGFGLDLTTEEDRALTAVQIMLSRLNYGANGESFESIGFKGRFRSLRLSFTWTEFYDAYGLRPGTNGRYGGERVKRARNALLKGLTKPRRIAYERRYFKMRDGQPCPLTDIIRVTSPILTVIEGYEGLNEEEAIRVRAGEDLPERVTRLGVEVSPMLSDMIGSYYLLKPNRLHEEIEQYAGRRRVSRSVSLFIEWLLTFNRPKIFVHRQKLAVRLRLSKLIEQRKHKILDARLDECFDAALKLGYLTKWRQSDQGVLTFHLNPERCPKSLYRSDESRKTCDASELPEPSEIPVLAEDAFFDEFATTMVGIGLPNDNDMIQ